jgi:uncharacterized membrane protein
MQHNEIDAIKKEVKKEFELERLKLFSDAVFAIVITMVAIEIKLPHFEEKLTKELLEKAFIHNILPLIFAYIISFFFIGANWYKHFKLFSVLKTYDLGLVLRNLLLLFFIVLFPFCVSFYAETIYVYHFLPYFLYFLIIFCCTFSEYILGKYILSKPELLDEDADITIFKVQYDYSKLFSWENIKKNNGYSVLYRKWRDRKNVKKN